MDDPALDRTEHARALRGLSRIHALTGTTKRLWRHIAPLTKQSTSPLTVMDVGCGDAMTLFKLSKCAQRAGRSIRIVGCDFSEAALSFAESESQRRGTPIELHQVDVTRDELPSMADVVICSLFLHHFETPQVADILRKMSTSTRRLLLVEDLLRSQLGYCLCWIGIHALSRSPVVHTDGLLSVRAALNMVEIRSALAEAGIANASVDKHWPERFLVQWRPGEERSNPEVSDA